MSAQRAAQLIEAGLFLRLSGDYEGAKRLFEQALRLDPTNARAKQLLDGGSGGAAAPAGRPGPSSVTPLAAPLGNQPVNKTLMFAPPPVAAAPTVPAPAPAPAPSSNPFEADWGMAMESPAPAADSGWGAPPRTTAPVAPMGAPVTTTMAFPLQEARQLPLHPQAPMGAPSTSTMAFPMSAQPPEQAPMGAPSTSTMAFPMSAQPPEQAPMGAPSTSTMAFPMSAQPLQQPMGAPPTSTMAFQMSAQPPQQAPMGAPSTSTMAFPMSAQPPQQAPMGAPSTSTMAFPMSAQPQQAPMGAPVTSTLAYPMQAPGAGGHTGWTPPPFQRPEATAPPVQPEPPAPWGAPVSHTMAFSMAPQPVPAPAADPWAQPAEQQMPWPSDQGSGWGAPQQPAPAAEGWGAPPTTSLGFPPPAQAPVQADPWSDYKVAGESPAPDPDTAMWGNVSMAPQAPAQQSYAPPAVEAQHFEAPPAVQTQQFEAPPSFAPQAVETQQFEAPPSFAPPAGETQQFEAPPSFAPPGGETQQFEAPPSFAPPAGATQQFEAPSSFAPPPSLAAAEPVPAAEPDPVVAAVPAAAGVPLAEDDWSDVSAAATAPAMPALPQTTAPAFPSSSQMATQKIVAPQLTPEPPRPASVEVVPWEAQGPVEPTGRPRPAPVAFADWAQPADEPSPERASGPWSSGSTPVEPLPVPPAAPSMAPLGAILPGPGVATPALDEAEDIEVVEDEGEVMAELEPMPPPPAPAFAPTGFAAAPPPLAAMAEPEPPQWEDPGMDAAVVDETDTLDSDFSFSPPAQPRPPEPEPPAYVPPPPPPAAPPKISEPRLTKNAESAWDTSSNPGYKLNVDAHATKGDAFDLIQKDDQAKKAVAPEPDKKDVLAKLLRKAKDAIDLDDHTGAMALINQADALAPNDSEVKRLKERSEATLQRMYESKIGDLNRIPRVKLKETEIIWLNLDHRAGFMLAQVDGASSFEDLFALSGMSRLDTARILAQLIDEGVIVA